jgi:hypothetical protein
MRSLLQSLLTVLLLSSTVHAEDIAVAWPNADMLSLATGYAGHADIRLRNTSKKTLNTSLQWYGSDGLMVEPARIFLKDFKPGEVLETRLGIDASQCAENSMLRVWLVPFDTKSKLDVNGTPLYITNGVATLRMIESQSVYAPRYTMRQITERSRVATEIKDPDSKRRSQAGIAAAPRVLSWSGAAAKPIEQRRTALPLFMARLVKSNDAQPAYLYETASLLHYWYSEDWIVGKLRFPKPAQRIAFDWQCADDVTPVVHEVAGQVRAVYRRAADQTYGTLELYPENSKRNGKWVTFPADKAAAFTFCTDKEVRELIDKWLANPHDGKPPAENTFAPQPAKPVTELLLP